jgi:hypothetical protein
MAEHISRARDGSQHKAQRLVIGCVDRVAVAIDNTVKHLSYLARALDIHGR